MVCINCGEKTHVTNSRASRKESSIWRRRECFSCGMLFTTTETPEYHGSWVVQSRDGALQPFSPDHLFLSLYKSCEHRQTALHDARALADTITRKLGSEVQHGILTVQTIIQTAQVALNRFDKAASVHYAAFHQG